MIPLFSFTFGFPLKYNKHDIISLLAAWKGIFRAYKVNYHCKAYDVIDDLFCWTLGTNYIG